MRIEKFLMCLLVGLSMAELSVAQERGKGPKPARERKIVRAGADAFADARYFRGVDHSGLMMTYQQFKGWPIRSFVFPRTRARWIKIHAIAPAGGGEPRRRETPAMFNFDRLEAVIAGEWQHLRAKNQLGPERISSVVLDLGKRSDLETFSLSLVYGALMGAADPVVEADALIFVTLYDTEEPPEEDDVSRPSGAAHSVSLSEFPDDFFEEDNFYFTKSHDYTALTLDWGKIARRGEIASRRFTFPPQKAKAVQIETVPSATCGHTIHEVNLLVGGEKALNALSLKKVKRAHPGSPWLSNSRHELPREVLAEGVELSIASLDEVGGCLVHVYLLPEGVKPVAGRAMGVLPLVVRPQPAVGKKYVDCFCTNGGGDKEAVCYLMGRPNDPRTDMVGLNLGEKRFAPPTKCHPGEQASCKAMFPDKAQLCETWL